MIAKSKQFKIERKKLVIHRQQTKKEEQNKENKAVNGKPHRKYSREKKLSQIESREPLEGKEVKKLSSSRSLQKNNSVFPVYKNNKEKLQISNNRENQKSFSLQTQQIHLIGRNMALNTILSDLIQKLKEKQLLFQSHVNCYLVEKNYFVHIIEYLISILSTNDVLQCNRLFHKLHQIRPNLQDIHKYSESSRKREINHSLSISSNVHYQQFRHQSFKQSLQQGKKLLINIKILNQEAVVKKGYVRQLSDEINKQKIAIDELKGKYEQLCIKIKGKEMQLAKVEELKNKFDNFAADNSQIIKQASQQFKRVEITFHNYIHNIQANSCLLPIDLQKTPISQQKLFAEQDRKTKMLKECIRHLRSWMNSWNIKHQILSSIKSQFINQNYKINQQFQQTTNISKDQPLYRTIQQIKSIYSKIEENYKLANLFY